MKKFTATLTFHTEPMDQIPKVCLPAIESFRQIVEANYNYAYEKYGNDFTIDKVDSYQCVNIAKHALKQFGITAEVTENS